MSDFVIAQIRTYVPIAVGFVLSLLVARGVIDEGTSAEATAAIASGLTAVLSGAYYFAVRALAERWPFFGSLLGVNIAPKYGEE